MIFGGSIGNMDASDSDANTDWNNKTEKLNSEHIREHGLGAQHTGHVSVL